MKLLAKVAIRVLRGKRALAAVRPLLGGLALVLLAACGEFHSVWHDEKLPSGRTVKVTSFNLVWGVEHDERDVRKDCFSMEFVTANPEADQKTRDGEALEVFELVRPVSEQWGFKSVEMAAFPTVDRKGHYNFYLFVRGADGKWSFTMEPRKVFAND